MNPIILTCAHLAEAVYRSAVPAGMAVLETIPIKHAPTSTSGMAYVTAGRVFIAIAGSSNRRHWLSNFKIIRKRCYGWLMAHKGFSECAEGVIDQCAAIMDKYTDREIVLLGHSQGGSVAVLIAAGLQSHARQLGQDRKFTLVTFGQPRVSQKALILSTFSGTYIRVQNGSDIVPRSPKLWYSHAGTLIYIKNGTGYCKDPGHIERFLDRLPTLFQRCSDHFMHDYLRELQRVS
jgi:pimeloyl-ACP methyl ester carboxylesterase